MKKSMIASVFTLSLLAGCHDKVPHPKTDLVGQVSDQSPATIAISSPENALNVIEVKKQQTMTDIQIPNDSKGTSTQAGDTISQDSSGYANTNSVVVNGNNNTVQTGQRGHNSNVVVVNGHKIETTGVVKSIYQHNGQTEIQIEGDTHPKISNSDNRISVNAKGNDSIAIEHMNSGNITIK